MNRINKLFAEKKDILSVYYTAGFPKLDDTIKVLKSLEAAGADLVEIGMPFSDPLADGPTIQDSSLVALNNGMSIKVLFEQLKDVRKEISIPIVLMGYINPVHKYGIENFARKCQEVGVDGVIIPDLPFDEYNEKYKQVFEAAGVSNIFLVTPQSPEARIRAIDANTNGFIYVVSSSAVTGAKKGLSSVQIEYFQKLQAMKLKNPSLIGFGISDNESFKATCKYASGAIVGSAFVKLIANSTNLDSDIRTFVKELKN